MPTAMQQYNQILTVGDLRAGYVKKEILHGVSLDVSDGETVGVIGANGAGKSTLLKAIFGLVQEQGGWSDGEIIFEGDNIMGLKPSKKARAGMGYVLQGGEVFSNLSVEDNLGLASRAFRNNDRGKQPAFIYELFPALYQFRKKRAGLLSGGQRQMLAIGLILTAKPRLLLLDEPTASLSLDAAEAVSAAIIRIKDELGVAMLLVEQNIDKCLALSDRIYLMRDGRVVDKDIPANILSENKLEKLFGVKTAFQTDYYQIPNN